MNEQIKKIGLIILFIFLGLISLVIVSQLLFRSTVSNIGENFKSDSLATSFSGGFAEKQRTASPSMVMEADFEAVDESKAATDKKIKKNGSLRIYVKEIEDSVNKIKDLTYGFEGEVIRSDLTKNLSGERSAYVTIKVPVASFEAAMGSIKDIATEVENESVDATDVTAEYVDLESQLRNLRAEESQYLKILDKAETVEEILNVTNYLSRVRGQIERIEGQLKYMDRQVDMSTININLSTDADFEVWGLRWRPLIVAKRAVKDLLSGLAGYADSAITFIIKLPLIVIWIITITLMVWIVWKIGGWVYKKMFKKKNLIYK